MSKTLQKIIFMTAVLALVHAAYSAAKCEWRRVCFKQIMTIIFSVDRTYLRITEQEFTTLPFDVILQTVISLAIVIYSILSLKSDYKLIYAADLQEKSSWEMVSNCQSFYTFNHRGKALFNPYYEQPSPTSTE